MNSTLLLTILTLLVATSAQLLQNPSWESGATGWTPYSSGFTVQSTNVEQGNYAISCTTTSTSASFGALQTLTLNQATAQSVIVTGYSKSTNVAGTQDNNYAIYADVTFMDGTHSYGDSEMFSVGTNGWALASYSLGSGKPIKFINLYAMFRSHSGTAYFDNFGASLCTNIVPTPSATNPLKVLVPFYVYPDIGSSNSVWTRMSNAVKANPKVPVHVIYNPNSGPGTAVDPLYSSGIANLTAAGATLIAYVHCSYGTRAYADVTADIDTYLLWYPGVTKGIFIDEAPYTNYAYLTYMQNLYAYIKSKGLIVYTNPGTNLGEKFTLASDSICTFESSHNSWGSYTPKTFQYCPTLTAPSASWMSHFTTLVYSSSANNYQSDINLAISRGYGVIYTTDRSASTAWTNLASYFESELAFIAAKNV
jgi:hypothetical protein